MRKIAAIIVILSTTATLPVLARAGTDSDIRVRQAKELLGRHYAGSVVSESESVEETAHLVRLEVRKSLKPKWKAYSDRIARRIMTEATRYRLDPFFIMAVCAHESRFDPEIRGSHTEIGLMQIKPKTARWVAERAGIRFKGDNDLFNPMKNIQIGAAYLAYLRNEFEAKGRLYVSAYNMGPTNVQRLVDRRTVPHDYANKVMERYIAFYLDLRDKFEEPSAEIAEF